MLNQFRTKRLFKRFKQRDIVMEETSFQKRITFRKFGRKIFPPVEKPGRFFKRCPRHVVDIKCFMGFRINRWKIVARGKYDLQQLAILKF